MFRGIRERLTALFAGARQDAEMDEELRFHLERETEKNIREGMTPAEARREALLSFGGVERFREQTREERGARPLEDFLRDLRFAGRTLRKAPAVVVVTVLSLGLGIATSATVFSMAQALVMGDVGPMTDPEDVVAVYTSQDDGGLYSETSFPDYLDLRDQSQTVAQLAAHRLGVLTVGEPESRDRLVVELVTGNYFQVLGVTPILGRSFLPQETTPGAAQRLFILSYRAWQERFGGDREILGRVLSLDGNPYTIIGVAPKGLMARYMKMDVDGWVPLGVEGGVYRVSPRALVDRNSRQFFMLGRLAGGRTVEEAQAEMSILAARLREEHPEGWSDARGEARVLTVVPEAESRVPPNIRAALLGTAGFLLGGAFFVLLLACSNVASLLLARAHRRSWEMAVRMSLGAGRGRLLRMLLAESLLLALAGGALGLGLAHVATTYLDAFPLPMDVPLRFDVGLDGTALLFTLVVTLTAALLAGIGPSLRGSKPSLTPALKGEGGLNDGRGRRISLRSLLVVGQVTAATLFVIGAGLAARSVQASADYDLGLNPDRVAVMWEEPPEEELGPDQLRTYFLELAQRIAAHPEVESVALARTAEAHPLLAEFATARIQLGGGDPLVIAFNAVTPGYLEMLALPLVRGRGIEATDRDGAPMVAVVNETFLDRFFPEGDGLGRRFTVLDWYDVDRREDRPETSLEIVGVVAAPERPGGGRARPFFWTSFLQDPPVRAIVHARGVRSAEDVLPVFRQEVPPAPGDFTPLDPGVYSDYIQYRFLGNRIIAVVLSFLGAFALALAFIGVFGIVSFAVGQRFREMAIRQALGAGKGVVIWDVLRGGLRGTFLGVTLGLVLAVPLAHLSRSGLLGVAPLDPLAVGGGTLLLVCASLLAGAIPALRLRRSEPMEVLREE